MQWDHEPLPPDVLPMSRRGLSPVLLPAGYVFTVSPGTATGARTLVRRKVGWRRGIAISQRGSAELAFPRDKSRAPCRFLARTVDTYDAGSTLGLLLAIVGTLCAGEPESAKTSSPGAPSLPDDWAFRPLNRPCVPESPAANQASLNPIDAFIRAKLEEHGFAPSPEADKRTLLRRVHFDLIGLPPTPDELRAFMADASPEAYEHAVDRLLASPRYGERWARHWMDAAHFAETHGHDQDRIRTNACP